MVTQSLVSSEFDHGGRHTHSEGYSFSLVQGNEYPLQRQHTQFVYCLAHANARLQGNCSQHLLVAVYSRRIIDRVMLRELLLCSTA